MLIRILSSFLLITLAVSPRANAGELTSIYRKQTEQVLAFLLSQGVDKIGCDQDKLSDTNCISVRALQNLLTDVFVEIPTFNKPQGATRWAAFASPVEQRVYLNASFPHDPALAGYVGLHELMQLAGTIDDQFKISTRVFLLRELSAFPTGEFVLRLLRNQIGLVLPIKDLGQRRNAPNDLLAQGGAVIVGGGGDPRPFYLRVIVLRHLIKDFSDVQGQIVSMFSELPIEVADRNEGKIT